MTARGPAELEVQGVLDGHEGDLTTVSVEYDHQLTRNDDG